LINSDLPLPQIAEAFPEYAYEQVYGTVLVDKELTPPLPQARTEESQEEKNKYINYEHSGNT
jgi:hypothetical protein